MKEGKYFMQLKTSTSNNNIAKKKKNLTFDRSYTIPTCIYYKLHKKVKIDFMLELLAHVRSVHLSQARYVC